MSKDTYRCVTNDTENRHNKTVRSKEHKDVYLGVKLITDADRNMRVLTAVRY